MSKKMKKSKSKAQMSVEPTVETPKEVIVSRIGDYLVKTIEGSGKFIVCRNDGLEWSATAHQHIAEREARNAMHGFDIWRQSSRGTGLLPSDFGRIVYLDDDYRRIIGFVPTAKDQKVITQDSSFTIKAYTVEQILKELVNVR